MAIEKISDSALLDSGKFHISMPDIPELSAQEMKEFMDYLPREVIIPKVNEIADGVNVALGLEDTGTESRFVSPTVNLQFFDGFYFNATAERLTEEGYYSSGKEHHLMDVTLENGSVRPIYIRSNYSGSYSIHPEPWIWNTDIMTGGPEYTYVSMPGYGKVTVTAVSELGLKFISLIPAADPTVKLATEKYVEGALPEIYVKSEFDEDVWHCRVWSNGRKECWCKLDVYFTSTQSDGVFVDPNKRTINMPNKLFTQIPATFLSTWGGSGRPRAYLTTLGNYYLIFEIETTSAVSGLARVDIYCAGE